MAAGWNRFNSLRRPRSSVPGPSLHWTGCSKKPSDFPIPRRFGFYQRVELARMNLTTFVQYGGASSALNRASMIPKAPYYLLGRSEKGAKYDPHGSRSEENTSELQSLMRLSSAVCRSYTKNQNS